MAPVIFTIGHSNHPAGRFLALLKDSGVGLIADVRSQPASRHAPWFGRAVMTDWLAADGIDYRWLGASLGGRPRDDSVYRPDGRPDYAKCAALPAFAEGIATLLGFAAERPTAIMCAERDPLNCHRTHLVTPALLAAGARVRHILADGTSIDHAALQQQSEQQPGLFD